MRERPVLQLGGMSDHDGWFDRERLIEFLGAQLARRRLALILGAGVSAGLGLPKWDDLLAALFANHGATVPNSGGAEMHGEVYLHDHCAGNRTLMATNVSTELYARFDASPRGMRSRPLLTALGALAMGGSRGGVRRVITFNYDDILEQFLKYYGFRAESVINVPAWESDADVSVYHPHGFLPFKGRGTETIVLAQVEFDEQVGNVVHPWRSLMANVMRTHTCLFVGTSGTDQNLSNLMTDIKTTHASTTTGDAFWGVRLTRGLNDGVGGAWKTRGVAPFNVESYDDIPDFIFDICQAAASRTR